MKKQKELYRVVQTLWGKRKTVKKDISEEEAHRHVAVMRRATGHAVEYHAYPMSTKPSEYI